MSVLKRNLFLSVTSAAFALGGVAHGQEDIKKLDTVQVLGTASRLPEDIKAMPGSVTLLDEKEISEQLRSSTDLEALLGQLVPGMGTSSASPANFTTSLRGRKPIILVDGIPLTDTLNDVGRELRLIDPSVIGRIEVVSGSSSLYGNSAGAGFINYVTKPGEKGEMKIFTELGIESSLTSVGDGLRPFIRQGLSGGEGKFDYRLVGYYEKTNGLYDADGDMIAPIPNGASGYADSDTFSGFGKVGYDVSDTQRLSAMITYYKQEQDTDYTLQPGDVSEGIKATAVPKDPNDTEEANQYHDNLVASVEYSNSDIFGSELVLQGYYQNNKSIFGYSANRFPLTSKPSAQSDSESTKYGARLDVTTPLEFLGGDSVVLWGVDLLSNESEAGMVDGREFAPTATLKSSAAFIQLRLNPIDPLHLTGGVRFEDSELEIDDFLSLFTLAEITGGTLNYDASPVNFGVTYDVTEDVNIFAGYTEGFEVASVTRPLRSWPVDVDVMILDPKPNTVETIEAGVRGTWSKYAASLSAFRTESSNGLSLRPDPANPAESVLEVRSVDEVYGYEMTFDGQITNALTVGGSYAWFEGKEDRDGDGVVDTPLQHRRIAPPKFTGYAAYDFDSGWQVRVQGLYSGSRRNKFPGSTAFYEGQINDWFTVDASASGPVGPGLLSVGLSNALNSDHYTHLSEAMQQDNRYSKAPGATVRVSYRIEY